jgi:hypothetical protein
MFGPAKTGRPPVKSLSWTRAIPKTVTSHSISQGPGKDVNSATDQLDWIRGSVFPFVL